MPRQVKYGFPDEEAAKRFVRTCARSAGLAFFRDGTTVTVIDPSELYGREIFRVARECGGDPV